MIFYKIARKVFLGIKRICLTFYIKAVEMLLWETARVFKKI